MNLNLLKKTSIITASIIGAIYAFFLIAPFIISPIANSYIPMVNDEIKKATGLNSKIENFRIITTPKLTIGANLGNFEILTPNNNEIFATEDGILYSKDKKTMLYCPANKGNEITIPTVLRL